MIGEFIIFLVFFVLSMFLAFKWLTSADRVTKSDVRSFSDEIERQNKALRELLATIRRNKQ